MITSVFLTNDSIRVITGNKGKKTVNVQGAYNMELSEGCLINGLITNEQELEEQIKTLWEQNNLPKKDVHIVVNSSHMTIRTMKTPALNEKKTVENIAREFAENDNSSERIYDYQIISHNNRTKMNEVLAVMVEQELIQAYIQLFKKLNIEVTSVAPGRGVLLTMFGNSGAMQGKNCIIQLLEGKDLHSILYVDGVYTYSTKTRLFARRKSEEFGVEMARSVSGILQFLTSQHIEQQISDIYFAGLLPGDIEFCHQGIDMLELGLSVSELEADYVKMPSDCRFTDYIFPVAVLMTAGKEINLVAAGKRQQKKEHLSPELVKLIRPVIVLTVLLTVVTSGLVGYNIYRQKELDELNDYIMEPSNVMAYQEALLLSRQLNSLKGTMNEVLKFSEAQNSYPHATTSVMDTVQQTARNRAEVTLDSYSAADGSLQMTAKAANVTLINQFIDELEATGLFENVAYSGYIETGKDVQEYSIKVACYLAEDAGK